jgi:hypothetical protein
VAREDVIAEIAVDGEGRLCVSPSSAAFPYVYREAMEVDWNPSGGFLFAPPRRKGGSWQLARWFQQIVAAAREQGCDLVVGPDTRWRNVPEAIEQEIRELARVRS